MININRGVTQVYGDTVEIVTELLAFGETLKKPSNLELQPEVVLGLIGTAIYDDISIIERALETIEDDDEVTSFKKELILEISKLYHSFFEEGEEGEKVRAMVDKMLGGL